MSPPSFTFKLNPCCDAIKRHGLQGHVAAHSKMEILNLQEGVTEPVGSPVNSAILSTCDWKQTPNQYLDFHLESLSLHNRQVVKAMASCILESPTDSASSAH